MLNTGGVLANWKRGTNPKPVLETLSQSISPLADGSFSLTRYEDHKSCVLLLTSMLSFRTGVSEQGAPRICEAATKDWVTTGRLDAEAFLAVVRRRERSYLRRPVKKYVLISQLSLRHFDELRRIRLGGSSISFLRTWPRGFEVPKARDNTPLRDAGRPVGYCFVRTSTEARDYETACADAIRRLDYIRSLWNFHLNYGSSRWPLQGTHRQPTNRLVYGPTHTLHAPDGRAIEDMAWWQDSYVSGVQAHSLSARYARVREYEREVRRRLLTAPLGDRFRTLLVRYGRALDEWRPSVVLPALWAVLEGLTGTMTDRYEVTIRRASFMFAETHFHRAVLGRLRHLRNSVVHPMPDNELTELEVFELRRAVEALFARAFHYALEFKNLAEWIHFLDQPPDLDSLRRRRALIDKAISFRGS